jgi:hypothetical protein
MAPGSLSNPKKRKLSFSVPKGRVKRATKRLSEFRKKPRLQKTTQRSKKKRSPDAKRRQQKAARQRKRRSNSSYQLTEASKQVHNLSSKEIPPQILAGLAKSIKHIYHTKPITLYDLHKCLFNLENKLQWAYLFRNTPTQLNPLKLKKSKEAPKYSLIVSEVISNIKLKATLTLTQQTEDPIVKHNIGLINRIKSFIYENKLIIKAADKNLGLTIMDMKDYYHGCMNLLKDEKTYREFQKPERDITKLNILLLHDFVKATPFTDLERKFILHGIESINIPEFYVLPKLHKSPLSFRPIVASTNWSTTQLSKYVSTELLKYMNKCPYVLKDSHDLLKQIKKYEAIINQRITGIVTADITTLYTNMKKDIIKSTFGEFLKNEKLLDSIMFVLNHNYLKFHTSILKQIDGMAMGTNMAVLVANIYCHLLLDTQITKLPGFLPNCIFYRRYIDDIIFFISNDKLTTESLKLTLELACPYLQFNLTKISDKQAFLDLDFYIDRSNKQTKLEYRTFQKNTSLYSYIQPNSCHPNSCKKGFIKGELLRYLRNSSTENAFINSRLAFFIRLKRRGYKEPFLDPIFASVKYSEKSIYFRDLVDRKDRPNQPALALTPILKKIMPIILPYSPFAPKLQIKRLILNEIKELHEGINKAFLQRFNFITAYTAQKNILRTVSNASITKQPTLRKLKRSYLKHIQLTLEDLELIRTKRIRFSS